MSYQKLCALSFLAVLFCISNVQAFPGYGGKSDKGLSKASKSRPRPELKVKTTQTGKVLETMDAERYTYVFIEQKDGKKIWAASERVQVGIGDTVEVINGSNMGKFTSKALKRTFEEIYFAPLIKVTNQLPENKKKFELVNKADQAKMEAAGKETAAGQGKAQSGETDPHAGMGINPVEKKIVVVKAGSVKKLTDGMTIKECLEDQSKLANKVVKIRAVVVKSTPNIMGKNWLHIKDGSGKEADELVVTTAAQSTAGDKVVVSGKISLNKDFGAGYFYQVIMEDATITKE